MTIPGMHEMIIKTTNLEFGFNTKYKVLKNINLKVERGSIYGFLGPNGAGKTTTIRVLLGLLEDRNNSVKLFGKHFSENRIDILSKTGSLIEQPSLYEHLSGYDNLNITRQIRKISKKRASDVLELVKLTYASHKKVKAYSLGMKQRLGIAIALLAEPELLILDEPVNGLDPNGMVEIRELLKAINKEFGTTVFLSSHLLTEIEKIVTHVGILNMGELLFQGTINDFRNFQTTKPELHIQTNNNQLAFELLKLRYDVAVNNFNENDVAVKINTQSKEEAAQIIRHLINHNIDIYEAVNDTKDIEQVFLRMTKNYRVN